MARAIWRRWARPPAELGRVGADALGEVKLVEQLGGAGASLGTGESEVAAVKEDVFGDGAGAVERVVLRDDADLLAGAGRFGDNVDAGDADPAGGGQGARGADRDGGCFAGAVGAEQTVDFAGIHLEVEAIDGGNSVFADVDFLEPCDFDNHQLCTSPAGVIIGSGWTQGA